MTYAEAQAAKFNPFDLTKIWSHQEFPLMEVGRLVLDQNPQNYFAEVEQLAFSPSHMIPGIEPSPDKMLQARLFSYPDTHRHRLGANYQQIPANAPLKADTFQRDGPMTVMENGGGSPNYFPNSFRSPKPDVSGKALAHADSVTGDVERVETGEEDNFTQCRDFFRNVLSAEERDRLTTNIANHMADASEPIRMRAISNFGSVDPSYGKMIHEKIKSILAEKGSGYEYNRTKGATLNPPRDVPNLLSKPSCPFGFSASKL